MKLKVIRNTIKAATITATNLVFANKTTRLMLNATENMLRISLNNQQLKISIQENALKAKILLGKFFKFKEFDDTLSLTDLHVLTTTKAFSDSAVLSDSGFTRTQNYTSDMSYFAENYVGQEQEF